MGVQADVFFNRTGGTDDVMFPISPGYRIPRQDAEKEVIAVVQRSCFGPGQRVNQTLVAAGKQVLQFLMSCWHCSTAMSHHTVLL
jgi:hypothetical protein